MKLLEEKFCRIFFVLSLIDIEMWNKVKWKGIVFVYNLFDENDILILGFGFENFDYGKLIFNVISN